MLDVETVTAMSREILRNHDRYLARCGHPFMRDRAHLEFVAARLAALPGRIALILHRIAHRA